MSEDDCVKENEWCCLIVKCHYTSHWKHNHKTALPHHSLPLSSAGSLSGAVDGMAYGRQHSRQDITGIFSQVLTKLFHSSGKENSENRTDHCYKHAISQLQESTRKCKNQLRSWKLLLFHCDSSLIYKDKYFNMISRICLIKSHKYHRKSVSIHCSSLLCLFSDV